MSYLNYHEITNILINKIYSLSIFYLKFKWFFWHKNMYFTFCFICLPFLFWFVSLVWFGLVWFVLSRLILPKLVILCSILSCSAVVYFPVFILYFLINILSGNELLRDQLQHYRRNLKWMKTTKFSNTLYMHPQVFNLSYLIYILSYLILPYLILCCIILSNLILSYPILSCIILSYFPTFHLILSCDFLFCFTQSHLM